MRIVTFNVLSSALAKPSTLATCDPDVLDRSFRLRGIQSLLQRHMDDGAVVCLQEVCDYFNDALAPMFDSADYGWVYRPYSGRTTGYMGVGIAFPRFDFALAGLRVVVVADQLDRFRARSPSATASGSAVVLSEPPSPRTTDTDPWVLAARAASAAVCLHLRPRDASPRASELREVVVACYHMPCKFRAPSMMTIHGSLLVHAVHHFAVIQAAAAGDLPPAGALQPHVPFVIAGDYNVKAGSDVYRFFTTGHATGTAQPPPSAEFAFTPSLPVPLRSAYAEAAGEEPPFTNFALAPGPPGKFDPFVETLDYVFMSPGLCAVAAQPTPSREACEGPLPSKVMPSDHLPVVVDVVADGSL